MAESPTELLNENGVVERGSQDPDSDVATGVGTLEDETPQDDRLEEMSDAGWESDLEIEEEKEEYDPSGRKTYLKTCKTLGIIPTSYFIRTIQNCESKLNMSHHGVGPKGAKAIAISLISNTDVTHVDLSDNGLGTEGTIAITTMMKENCYITHLNLADNEAGPPATYAIAQMMASNSTLTHLVLRGNLFNDQSAEPLAEVIKTSLHIKYLDLSHNEFGEAGGVILGPALGDSESLQVINLSWNHLRRKGAEAIAESIKVNPVLKEVNLAYNGFADKGMTALADALKVNSTLCQLDVSNNRITQTSAIVVAKVLPSHEALKVLNVGCNPIQPAGLAALLDGVKTTNGGTFECLDLSGITIPLDIEKAVGELKESHPHISIPHGGVGGFKPPKPLLPPMAKLVKYCKENKVELLDLFRLFDKEQKMILSDEEFRNALKHISSPLLEFERKKLINEYKTDPPKPSGDEEAEAVPPPETGEEGPVFIDYMVMVGVAKTLDGTGSL